MNGLLVVDKPGANDAPADRLWTSHDVVQRVRRLSGERRIGHTGTLDPMASGVLVLCLGPSTRLVEYLQGHPKRYLAEIHFGAATDTYDATGAIVEQKPVPDLQSEDVARVLEDFRGEQMQQPPAFSAIKQDGERLYRKARRGDKVEARPRPITVHELILVDWSAPDRLAWPWSCRSLPPWAISPESTGR